MIAAAAPQKPSDAWRNFTYAQTAASILVVGGLIFWSEIDQLLKVALSVATAWALTNSVSITKLLRDRQEYEDWQDENKKTEPVRTPRLATQAEA